MVPEEEGTDESVYDEEGEIVSEIKHNSAKQTIHMRTSSHLINDQDSDGAV